MNPKKARHAICISCFCGQLFLVVDRVSAFVTSEATSQSTRCHASHRKNVHSIGQTSLQQDNENKASCPPCTLPQSFHKPPPKWCPHPPLDSLRRQLIELGAFVDAPARSRATPLHLAVQNGQPSAARLLVSRSADLEARDWLGRTALHHACDYARMNGLDNNSAFVLIGSGADVHSQDIFWFVKNTAVLGCSAFTCTDFGLFLVGGRELALPLTPPWIGCRSLCFFSLRQRALLYR